MVLQEIQALNMVIVVLIYVGVERAGIDEDGYRPTSACRISSIRTDTSCCPLRPEAAAIICRRPPGRRPRWTSIASRVNSDTVTCRREASSRSRASKSSGSFTVVRFMVCQHTMTGTRPYGAPGPEFGVHDMGMPAWGGLVSQFPGSDRSGPMAPVQLPQSCSKSDTLLSVLVVRRTGRVPWLLVATLCASLLGFGCAATHSDASKAGDGGVIVEQLSPVVQALLADDFNKWEALPSTCLGQIKAGSVHAALIPSSQEEWAIATFEPAPGCQYSLNPAGPGLPLRPVPVDQIGPWGHRPVGVFGKSSGGAWRMNGEGSIPFPCPAPAGVTTPASEFPAAPSSVLAAWKITYAANCTNAYYPVQPRTSY